MCTHHTVSVPLAGSGKGPAGWFPVGLATVYFDHPVDAPYAHTLNIDFRNPQEGPAARVAVELDAAGARSVAEAILSVLAAVPAELRDDPAPPAAARGGQA